MNRTHSEHPLNVLLIEHDQAKASAVMQALGTQDYHITHVSSGGLALLKVVDENQPDLIIMDVESPDRDMVESLNQMSQINPKPIVMFSEQGDTETIHSLVKSGVSAYIVGDVDAARVKSIVDIAMVRFTEYQELKNELLETKKKLTSQKTIEQAKIWLMETKQLTEKEAYHRMRKMAMDNGQTIDEVAKNLLSVAAMLDL